jgi:hypothetical protein
MMTASSFIVTPLFRVAAAFSSRTKHTNGINNNLIEVAMSTEDSLQPIRRKAQKRRKPRNRRPRNYWTQPDNLAREIRLFWANDCGLGRHNATLKYDENMIPNESLMNYYGRHDMRAAFASLGGREAVAEQLGGARILPGRWKEAVQDPQIEALIQIEPDLSSDVSPLSALDVSSMTEEEITPRWSHQSDRKPSKSDI